jgi:hypothetical protein
MVTHAVCLEAPGFAHPGSIQERASSGAGAFPSANKRLLYLTRPRAEPGLVSWPTAAPGPMTR